VSDSLPGMQRADGSLLPDGLSGVTMKLCMDDVPAGKAEEAVNGGHPAGDCLRACVATVLGLPLEDVPHFVQYIEHPAGTDRSLWWWAMYGFCRWYGWAVGYNDDPLDPPKGWALADGKSPRGHMHVVVAYDGEVVFDPHPSRAGLTDITGWMPMVKKAALHA
jgi:hypothetical protein